jgi:hypothetical protein
VTNEETSTNVEWQKVKVDHHTGPEVAINSIINSSKDTILVPAERPSRLPFLIHSLVVLTLALSFISGVIVWYGQTLNADTGEQKLNVRGWLLLHGYLNPLLCIVFGYLLALHIRYGWAMRANWLSGLIMEAIFAVQIVTGVLLYYAAESWRPSTQQIHHYAGLLLPLALIVHWIASQFWVKKVQNPVSR